MLHLFQYGPANKSQLFETVFLWVKKQKHETFYNRLQCLIHDIYKTNMYSVWNLEGLGYEP
jgi:hypothetical protein